MSISIQKLFYSIAILIGLFTIIVLGKPVLVPLAFSVMFAFIMYPVARKLESWGLTRILSSLLCVFMILGFFTGLIFFFSHQISNMNGDFPDVKDRLTHIFTDVVVYVNDHINLGKPLKKEDILKEFNNWLERSAGNMIGDTFTWTTMFIAQAFASLIYTFLILIDRSGISIALTHFASGKDRAEVWNMIKRVQAVGQKYLFGMMIIIFVDSIFNCLGLWIIGLDNFLLLGVMATLMSIIPYVGTTIGASIPVLYAFMTTDSLWIPFAVAMLFWFVQLMESNFLTPFVVGGKVHLNPLASILSLVIGGVTWGVPGLILFLPLMAMFRIFCDEFNQLRPIAALIGSHDDHRKPGPIKRFFQRLIHQKIKPKEAK